MKDVVSSVQEVSHMSGINNISPQQSSYHALNKIITSSMYKCPLGRAGIRCTCTYSAFGVSLWTPEDHTFTIWPDL